MSVAADERLTLRDHVRTCKDRGYEGQPCEECGEFTLLRNGIGGNVLKCDNCGHTMLEPECNAEKHEVVRYPGETGKN